MVENIFEELDAPSEWFHDSKSSTLYFFPAEGDDLANASVEVVRLRHLFDTVLETGDHGSFNSWGRGRFWKCASSEDLEENRDLPFLDAIKTTVIRDSRWRCDHGWDIDLDDGSRNYDIYNNLLLNGGITRRVSAPRVE